MDEESRTVPPLTNASLRNRGGRARQPVSHVRVATWVVVSAVGAYLLISGIIMIVTGS